MRIAIIIVASVLLLGGIGYLLARYFLRATVTSWWRSPLKNSSVGGKWWSLHLIGLGLDLVPATKDMEQKARRVFPAVLNEGDHIHVQLLPRLV